MTTAPFYMDPTESSQTGVTEHAAFVSGKRSVSSQFPMRSRDYPLRIIRTTFWWGFANLLAALVSRVEERSVAGACFS